MSTNARRFALGTVLALLLCGIALWPVGRASLEHLVIEPELARWDVAPPETAPTPHNAQRLPVAPSPGALPPAAESGNEQPHPLTPERELLQQELRLVGALQDALDLEDVPALRSLIARYRAHVPSDENKLAEGYARLADCLQVDHDHRDDELAGVRAAAAAYYESERASTLRRYIRRICLER